MWSRNSAKSRTFPRRLPPAGRKNRHEPRTEIGYANRRGRRRVMGSESDARVSSARRPADGLRCQPGATLPSVEPRLRTDLRMEANVLTNPVPPAATEAAEI